MSTSTFLRLCSRAPRTRTKPEALVSCMRTSCALIRPGVGSVAWWESGAPLASGPFPPMLVLAAAADEEAAFEAFAEGGVIIDEEGMVAAAVVLDPRLAADRGGDGGHGVLAAVAEHLLQGLQLVDAVQL